MSKQLNLSATISTALMALFVLASASGALFGTVSDLPADLVRLAF